jgi:hypothetical protein
MQVTEKFSPGSLEHEQQVLARLADGSLDERERESVEAYVATSREAQLRLARQRRVVTALRSGGPALSDAAREELDSLIDKQRRVRSRRATVSLPRLGIAVAAIAAVAAVGIVLAVGGAGSPPSITKTALLAYRSPTKAAPAVDAGNPRLLRATFAGITFPNYRQEFGVTASGQRTDDIGNRKLLTVYYRLPNGSQISYSVVSGTALAAPRSAQLVTYLGVQIRGYTQRGLAIVTLVRNGRTCVLAGRTSVARLIDLAKAPLRTV